MNPNLTQLPQLSPAAIEGLRALLTIIEAGLAAAPPPPVAPRRTIQELGNEFFVSRACKGGSVRYLIQLRSTFTRLFRGKMLRQVHTVTTAELEAWTWNLEGGASTHRGAIKDARTLFAFAQRRAYVSSNPATALELPRQDNRPVAIQTPEQVAAVMHAAQVSDPDIMRLLAVQYFAGLRSSEAHRLTEAEILPRYIEVKAEKCKTRRRRLVPITPTLRAWLDAGGRLPVESLWKRLLRVKRGAGVPFPPNAARHSFCSYHLAHHGSAARTAMEAGHSETMLFAHYRELVTPETAAAFWAIAPQPECELAGQSQNIIPLRTEQAA